MKVIEYLKGKQPIPMSELTDFELIKAEIELCDGAMYVSASMADMYYQMSFGTMSKGEKQERIESIITSIFFDDPETFLPGEYTLQFKDGDILLVGTSETDFGWHSGYDADTVEDIHRDICLSFEDEMLALGLTKEEINQGIATEAIMASASFGADAKGELTAEGSVSVIMDTVDASFEINDANSHYVTNPLWELCQGFGTSYFEGGIEGTSISSFVELKKEEQILTDYISGL